MEDEAELEFNSTQKDTPPPYTFQECKEQLMSEFRSIKANDISKFVKLHKGHYTESHMSLRLVVDTIRDELQNNGNDMQATDFDGINVTLNYVNGESEFITLFPMTRKRGSSNTCPNSKELVQEVKELKEQIRILDEEASRQVALRLLKEDYSKMGQLIECACCFGQCVFDNMAQCTEGHLVCVECLHSYINEIAFGTGKIALNCMMPECTAEYPQCELKRCLDPKIRSKLEERTLFENLNAAQIKDLVRCPYCDFAAILPHNVRTFSCHRDTCGKVTCRHCSGDWKDHVGKTCSMVENRDEASLRKDYEEKMTRAKVRTCPNCYTKFTKRGGCNEMTCRCGMTMCYVCRKPLVTDEQILAHCYMDCEFVTNPEEDDEMAIQEIKREAMRKRKALGYVGNREIGVPAAKKRRF